MARGQGSDRAAGAHLRSGGSRRPHPPVDPHMSTIVTRLERIPPQAEALKRALAQFADRDDFERAFISDDPDDVNRVVQVKGGFENLVNHLTNIIKRSHALVGLAEPNKRYMQHYVRIVRDDGGLTAGQADALIELHFLRSRLQHASPDVQADEVWEKVRVLQRVLPRARAKLLAWLDRKGHRIQP